MLEDGQVYESDQTIIMVEKWGKDYRSVIFRKVDSNIRLSTVVMDRPELIEKMIKNMELKLTDKKLILK